MGRACEWGIGSAGARGQHQGSPDRDPGHALRCGEETVPGSERALISFTISLMILSTLASSSVLRARPSMSTTAGPSTLSKPSVTPPESLACKRD